MSHNESLIVTCSAPVNIAVIKYWGKRNESLILPVNSSLSASLNQDQLKTTTTVMASKDFDADRMWLNGEYVQKSGFILLSNFLGSLFANGHMDIANLEKKICLR